MGMQQLFIEGRLVSDPELKTVGEKETSLVQFKVAVDGIPKNGEKTTEFFSCKAFMRRAQVIDEYFKKGDAIGIIGKIQTETWADRETGVQKYRAIVIVDQLWFPTQKPLAQADSGDAEPEERPAAKPAKQRTAATKPAARQQQDDAFGEDIPF